MKSKFLPLSLLCAWTLQGCSSAPIKDDTAEYKNTTSAIAELEHTQQSLLTRLNALKRDGSDSAAQREAETGKRINEFKSRPRKTFISPSTREIGYAMYYDAVTRRIEKIGTLEFPQHDGKSVYGELILSIPIFQDGTIYEQDGGPKVERSSGNELLDKAALRIARRAAPYGTFPKNMRTPDKDDVWVITTRFNFTNIDDVPANLPEAGN
jgi:protein TonB